MTLTSKVLEQAKHYQGQRKREDKIISSTEEKLQEASVPETQPKSNLTRNILIGSGLTLAGLFFYRRKKKSSQQTTDFRTKHKLEATMRLTPNITLGEYLVSSEAPELKEYILSAGELDNVKRNAVILQLIRNHYGQPIFINSGGRPDTMKIKSGKYQGLTLVQMLEEKGYKPSSFSQHMDFSAVDFTVTNKKDLVDIYEIILNIEKDPVIGPEILQAILYIENGLPNFIHLGTRSVLNNFEKIIRPQNKHLIAKVTSVVDSTGKKHRSTEFFSYKRDVLDTLLKV